MTALATMSSKTYSHAFASGSEERMTKSLQTKMVLIMVLLAISLMLIVGTMLVNNVVAFYNDDFLRQLDTFFNDDTIEMMEEQPNTQEVFSRMEIYSSQIGIDSYRNFYIFDRSGNLLQGTNMELGAGLEHTPNLMKALSGELGRELNVAMNYMDYAVPLEDHVIYVKDTKDEVRSLTMEIVIIIVETLFATSLIAILLSFILAKTITNPIEKLTKGADKISKGDFSAKLSISSQDEIGVLTETFNNMANTLKNTLDDANSERNKLNTIFLYLADGVAVFEGSGVLQYINKAALSMLGTVYREGESTFDSLFPEEIVSITQDDIYGSKESLTRDFTVDGRTLKLYFAAFMLPSQDEEDTEGIIAVIHDVTEEQRLEGARREFVANVSHELRTPLTNIKSYTETVLDNEDLPTENRNNFLTVVLNESDRMTRIVKDLLTLSRLDSDKLELRPSVFNISDMLKRVCEAMKIEAYNNRHILNLTLDNLHVQTIKGDEERIEQVVVNIVSNAIKYTPEGGKIEIGAYERDNKLCIFVNDNGMGIPEKDVPRIFDRFYRVDKARSREKGGTGLGLAIAKEMVEAHGGNISIDSKFGKYTKVLITLPLE